MPWSPAVWTIATRIYHTKKTNISNPLCRIVCKLSKFRHVTPFLHEVHGLPVQYRILFKYNLIKLPQAIRTWDSINGFRQQFNTYLFRLVYPTTIVLLSFGTLTWTWTIFWKSDYPFLDISASEDVFINLALYK